MLRPRVTRRWGLPALLAALTLVIWIICTPHVAASTELVSISPADRELKTSWPDEVTLVFSEPLDPVNARIRLLDPDGADIPGVQTRFADDATTVSLVPPADLGHATYTVVWEIPVEDSDEPIRGYSSFTIGTASDGAVVTVPSTDGIPGGPPPWLQALGRGLSLLGMTALVAIWPIWTIVIRPVAGRSWARSFVRHALRFAAVATVILLAGSILDLATHARTTVGSSWLDQIMNVVGQTRWGYAWTARMVLAIALGVVLGLAPWWFPRRRQGLHLLAWALSLALPLTFSLAGHGWDPPVGRPTAVGSSYMHGVTTAFWAGGILVLLGVLVPALRRATARDRTGMLAGALTRFSAVTIAAWTILALTGAYAAWLQAGNRTALTTTDYGRAAIAKIAAAIVVFVVLAVTLLVIRPQLAKGRTGWIRPLTGALAVQAGLIVVILATTGQMGTTAPARDVLVDHANQIALPVMLGDRPSKFLIAPGATGVNHLRLEVPGRPLPNLTAARVHVALPDHPELGEKDILLSRVSGNNFEHHGTEFSINGTWEMVIGLAEPNMPELTQRLTHTFGAERPEHDVPAPPWRFKTASGISMLILLGIGVVGVVVAAYAGRTPLRKEAGGVGAVSLALVVVIVLQGRFDPILAGSGVQSQVDPDDLLMVERGELVYTDYCLSCHGVGLRGDGPLGESMDPPPADFAAPHTFVHPDHDMIYWIRNGKQGTGMPAFGDQLSDQEMLDVLAYIKNRQRELGE